MQKLTLKNIELYNDDEFLFVEADLITEKGKIKITEYVNKDGTVETTDSNILTHINIEDLFDLNDKPTYMPAHHYLGEEIGFIFGELQGYVDENGYNMATETLSKIKKMSSIEKALEFCKNNKELLNEDITECENYYTNVFTFKDESILYIGTDNEIYTDNCKETTKMNNW